MYMCVCVCVCVCVYVCIHIYIYIYIYTYIQSVEYHTLILCYYFILKYIHKSHVNLMNTLFNI